MAPHRVVITGLGCVSPYGFGVTAFWEALLHGQSGLRCDAALKTVLGRAPDDLSAAGSERANELGAELRRRRTEMSRAAQLALLAADEAYMDASMPAAPRIDGDTELSSDGDIRLEMGVNIGSGISDLCEIHSTGLKLDGGQQRRVSPYFVPKILTNIAAGYVAQRYGLTGGNVSSAMACATGAASIGDAFERIRTGRWRAAMAGATESCLNEMAVVGFTRMKALATGENGTISRPFDRDRNGFVLSEGAAILVLENLEDALRRKAKIYAEILGYGLASDAHHLTSPEPHGRGSLLCMERCLCDAGIAEGAADRVTYVNAHATSTPLGDRAEAISIRDFAPVRHAAVSSLKGHIGHAQAAAGALETLAVVLSVRNGVIPPTLNLCAVDEDDGAAADTLDLVRGERPRAWLLPPGVPRRVAVKNSFGFGGAFVALAVAEYRP